MAMQGRVGWVAQFVGLGTILAALSAAGSLMATVYLGSLTLLHGWTWQQQALALLGFFVVLFGVIKVLLTEVRRILFWIVRGAPWRTSISDISVAGGSNTTLLESMDKKLGALLSEFSDAPQPVPGLYFHPRSIIADRPGIALAGLWNAEPSFTVWLNIRNASGFPVEITGATGRISIAGIQCRMPYEAPPHKSGLIHDALDRAAGVA